MKKNSVLLLQQIKFYVIRIIQMVLKYIETVFYELAFSIVSKLYSSCKNACALFGVVFKIPLNIIYYIYFAPSLYILTKLWSLCKTIFLEFSKHSEKIRVLHVCLCSLHETSEKVLHDILSSNSTEFIPFCVHVILEAIVTWFWPPQKSDMGRNLSLDELSELLAYEEMEDEEKTTESCAVVSLPPSGVSDLGVSGVSYNGQINQQFGRSKSIRLMHSYVPTNPFKATIRTRRCKVGSASSLEGKVLSKDSMSFGSFLGNWGLKPSDVPGPNRSDPVSGDHLLPLSEHPDSIISSDILCGADSPASFPSTPFSRAYVMNRASEKVVTVMFAARDRLRLEAQSVSRDEFCRAAAKEAKTSGQFAVFDPNQASSGIALSCGNHCAIKVGSGLCCCCRSMVPVRTNAYVYFEFSITVCNAQVPSLGIGLAPLDCPMNVMVGSWPGSVGLSSDGQIMIGSHWFKTASGEKCAAGSTVGVLVYIGGKSTTASSVGIAGCSGSTDVFPFPQSGLTPLLSRVRELGAHKTSSRTCSPAVCRMSPLYEDCKSAPRCPASGGSGGAADVVATKDENSSADSSYESEVEPPCLSPDQQTAAPNPSEQKLEEQKSISVPADTHPLLQNISVRFSVNGRPVGYSEEVRARIGDVNVTTPVSNRSRSGTVESVTPSGYSAASSSASSLYPTVSLFSEDTRVWCRFCEADAVYRSRQTIGAPEGVRVYCLDGSLLLREID